MYAAYAVLPHFIHNCGKTNLNTPETQKHDYEENNASTTNELSADAFK